jgi:hypothetical protein
MANMSRRDILRYGAAGAVTVGAAAVTVQAATAAAGAATGPQQAAADDPRDFDEDYKDKRIKGKHNANGAGKHDLKINKQKLAISAISTLFIPKDGSEPYVGRGYITALNHYDPVEFDDDKKKDGLKRLAMKVVDILGKDELTAEAAQEHEH